MNPAHEAAKAQALVSQLISAMQGGPDRGPGHCWGGAAICQRMGWKSLKPLRWHIKRRAFPAFKRRDPRNPLRVMWYSNEALISRWEWLMVQAERERLSAHDEEQAERLRLRDRYSHPSQQPPTRPAPETLEAGEPASPLT